MTSTGRPYFVVLTILVSLTVGCPDSTERPADTSDAGVDAGPEDPPARVQLAETLSSGEAEDLQLVTPSGPTDGPKTIPTESETPAKFVAARRGDGTVRYIGVVPPDYSGTLEIGPESTALGLAFLRIGIGGFTPKTQRRLLERMQKHPKFSALRAALDERARYSEQASPFAPTNERVHELTSDIVGDVLDPEKLEGGAEKTRRSQDLKIGDMCIADGRLSCNPDRCRGGSSGIAGVEKGVKYCVGDQQGEVLVQNPKTVYYGVQAVKPNGKVRDTSLVQAKGGLLDGFAKGPKVSDIRAKSCDQIRICQDFTKLDKIGNGNPCALGAGANAVKALGLTLGMVLTGSELAPEGSNIRKFAKLFRRYRDSVLGGVRGEAIMTLAGIATGALESMNLDREKVWINLPGGRSYGPVDVDDLQALLKFISKTASLLKVGPSANEATDGEEMSAWKDHLDDLVSAKREGNKAGGTVGAAKAVIEALAGKATAAGKSKVGAVLKHEHVDKQTVTTAVAAVGLVGLVAELRDGDIDFDRFARLMGLAMQRAPEIAAELGVELGKQAAKALATSLISALVGSKSAELGWHLGNRVVPFIHDLTIGGFVQETFTVPKESGGSCAPSCAERCRQKGKSCGTLPGCPADACGDCGNGQVCTSGGSCAAPLKTCQAARTRFESVLSQRPEVGVTDIVSGVEPVWSRLEQGTRARQEFGELASCVLSECRDSSFPRRCYRRAVTGGGACSEICSARSAPGAGCSPGSYKLERDVQGCGQSTKAVYRCRKQAGSNAMHWERLGCRCDAEGSSTGVCKYGYRESEGGSCVTPLHQKSPERACSGGDGIDNDCDGTVDEVARCNCTQSVYYLDKDGDGFGTTARTARACGTPNHGGPWATGRGDCAPGDPEVHPDHSEFCDGLDNDCNGTVDENCDADGDGYCRADRRRSGSPAACPNGGGDCGEDDPTIHPNGEPACDGRDNDCDGRVDEPAPISSSAYFSHAVSEKKGWGSKRKRMVSTPTDDGVCAAFLDASGEIGFTHVRPNGTRVERTHSVSGKDPAELLEMAWSGESCALIYRRKDSLTPDDNLFLARWSPTAPSTFVQVSLTNDTYNSTGDRGITGLEFVSGLGWVAAYVETHVGEDDLQLAVAPKSFGGEADVRRSEVSKLNVETLGPWPSIDVGRSPDPNEPVAVVAAARWDGQYQIRAYSGRPGDLAHRPALDVAFGRAKRFARLQLDSTAGRTLLTYHDNQSEEARVREVTDAGSGLAYGRSGKVGSSGRSGRPPQNLLGGNATVGTWVVDPRENRVLSVDFTPSSIQLQPVSHSKVSGDDVVHTVYAGAKSGRLHAFTRVNARPFRTEFVAYSCY